MKKDKNKKYYFNPETLSFEEYKVSSWKRFKKGFSLITMSVLIATGMVVVGSNIFESPKEMALKREVDQFKLNYEILNDRLDQVNKVLGDVKDRDDNIYRVIFEAEPVPESVRKAGYGGADRYAKLDGYTNSELIIEATKRMDVITSQLYVQSTSFDEVYELAKRKAELLSSLPAIQPLNSKDINRISSYFGSRPDPFYKVKKFHSGIDFSAPVGTPIYATGDAKVISIKKSSRGYGNCMVLDHGFGYQTRYAHINEFKVKRGDKIKRGQIIATVGNTGKSTGPHLHYEVLKKDKPTNPIHYFFNDLTPEEYEAMLDRSTLPSQSMD